MPCFARIEGLGRASCIAGLCAALLVLSLASGARADTGGAISGTVTSASTHASISGIRVCAESTIAEVPPSPEGEEGEEESEAPSSSGCTTTNGSGQYTISSLTSGNYYVEFSGATPSSDYITEFYDGKLAAAEVEQVTVTVPATTSGIDAEMQLGAEITGAVTEAASGAPLAPIAVCPQARTGPRAGVGSSCAITNTTGAYTIYGLPSGGYTVGFTEFSFRHTFEAQYYNDKSSPAEATVLQLTAPNVTSDINAALQRTTDHSGKGSPLGSIPTKSTSPGGVSPAEPSAQSPLASGFAVVVRSTKVAVRSGVAQVRLECHAPCHGRLAIQAVHAIKQHGKKVKRTVTIGYAGFTIAAEHATFVRVKLDATGRALLKRARGQLACTLSVTQVKPAPRRTRKLKARLIAHASGPKAHG